MSPRPNLTWAVATTITLGFLGALIIYAHQDPGKPVVDEPMASTLRPYTGVSSMATEGIVDEVPENPPEEQRAAPVNSPSPDPPGVQPHAVIAEEGALGEEIPIEEGLDEEEPGRSAGTDPTHEEVLGPPSWMAQPTEEESARIEEVFDEAQRRRLENPDTFQLEDRHTALEHARGAVERCFDDLLRHDPDIMARVIVAFDVYTSDGLGHIEDGQVTVYFGDQNETFERCVADTLNTITFGAVGEGVHQVEYPFFFDE